MGDIGRWWQSQWNKTQIPMHDMNNEYVQYIPICYLYYELVFLGTYIIYR